MVTCASCDSNVLNIHVIYTWWQFKFFTFFFWRTRPANHRQRFIPSHLPRRGHDPRRRYITSTTQDGAYTTTDTIFGQSFGFVQTPRQQQLVPGRRSALRFQRKQEAPALHWCQDHRCPYGWVGYEAAILYKQNQDVCVRSNASAVSA